MRETWRRGEVGRGARGGEADLTATRTVRARETEVGAELKGGSERESADVRHQLRARAHTGRYGRSQRRPWWLGGVWFVLVVVSNCALHPTRQNFLATAGTFIAPRAQEASEVKRA